MEEDSFLDYNYIIMNQNYQNFIQAIHEKKIVKVQINSYEKWIIERFCIPFDFWPSRIFKDKLDRYHFWDLNSPDGSKHNLSILPDQLLSLIITEDNFNPWDYVKREPKRFIARDWWIYS